MDDLLQNTISALDSILDDERRALLNGDLELISSLLKEKETLIETLNAQEETDRAELENLNDKVKRNQDLLNSALEGIRTVARRLATMRRIRGSLDTYDAQGRKKTVDLQTSRSVEKRA